MAGADFFIAQGDTTSPLATTLLDKNDDPVDLAGATVTLQLYDLEGGTSSVVSDDDANAQVGDGSDGSMGNVSYDWNDGETEDAGYYLASFLVTFAGGDTQTYPNDAPFLVAITPDGSRTYDALATTTDLETRLGVEFTATEHVRAKRLLELASGLIRAATGQTISLVESDVLTRRGSGATLRLPQRPVGDVESVTIDGVTIDPAGYYLLGDELVRASWGGSGFGSNLFGYANQELVVTYSHGYESVPDEVKAICLEMVVRVWTNPASVVSSSVGQVQTTYTVTGTNGLLLTDAERDALNELTGRSLGTISLR